MKKKLKSLFATIGVLTIIFGTQVLGGTTAMTFTLPAGTVLTAGFTKTTGTDVVAYNLYDVYPTNGADDNYTRIKLGTFNVSSSTVNVLLSERVIYENTGTHYYGYSKNLSAGDNIKFTLRGNNPELSAYADMYLNWY